jgi:hypothetical protein
MDLTEGKHGRGADCLVEMISEFITLRILKKSHSTPSFFIILIGSFLLFAYFCGANQKEE